ncbi:hypothetical protein, partial [Pseudomonas plecoglossicida]|uniref:hypothetical protein n=1 Tax=Pseudomonas plecoglossicida TaxID=70775 RepID=UPI001C3F2523
TDHSIEALPALPGSFNSLNLKEFLVPTTLEVGRIIRGFETPSTFNFIYLKYSGEDRIKASRCLPRTFCTWEIERRPRGASRLKPLLRLLQRATFFQARVVRLWRPPRNRVVSSRLATMPYQA